MEAVDALRGFSRHCLNQCQRVEEYLVSFFHYELVIKLELGGVFKIFTYVHNSFHVNYFDHFFVSLDDEVSVYPKKSPYALPCEIIVAMACLLGCVQTGMLVPLISEQNMH